MATRSSAIAVIADRTACSILTLFIVTATSRPLNKKIRLLSIRRSKNYTPAVRTPLSAPAVSGKAINSTGLGQQSASHRTAHGTQVSSAWQFVFCGAFCG